MKNQFIQSILELVAKSEISEENAFSLIKQYQSQLKSSTSSRDIAIIGVACRFPFADTKEQFWENTVNGVDGVREFPYTRFHKIRPFLKNEEKKSFVSAGYLDEIDSFDAEFFNILPIEAKNMDPQQRIFMETGYEAIEDAGYGGKRIKNSRTGVYVGFSEPRYKDLNPVLSPSNFIGNYSPFVASRLPYALNLKGPAISVATACSSSLVALHSACEGLLAGDCEMALVGGVAIGALPGKLETDGLGISSPHGRSRSFDTSADGTAWGEGCGVILIKRLEQAIQDQDHIYSVIKASAINHDGTSNGIASPNARSQEEVIIEAWKKADIDPLSVTYMEAHGTGTKIGDPIEVKGLTNAFRRYTDKSQFCGLGSVKSNIGHLDSASGMAGLIKTTLALKYKKIPPSLHFTCPNPLMNMQRSPLYINSTLGNWDSSLNHPRRAGVSSFGVSGTNCHVVLEEYNSQSLSDCSTDKERVFTLSARSEGALKILISKYVDFLLQGTQFNVEEICYVLNTGREHFKHRLAIPVKDTKQLLDKLLLILDCSNEKKSNMEQHGIFSSLFYGSSSGESLTEMSVLAKQYADGKNISWEDYYPTQGCNKVPLPTYAWEKKYYWVDPPSQQVAESGSITNKLDINKDKITLRDGYIPTVTENKIAMIWGKVLGVEEVGIDEDFFQLGGDSLLATEIVITIKSEFQIDFTLSDFFDHSNIRDLSFMVEKGKQQSSAKMVPVSERRYYPISSAQRRQYILNQLDEKNLSYNMPGVAIITGDLDVERLHIVFNTLVQRHESFRTVFDVVENDIIQRVFSQIDFVVEYSEKEKIDTDQLIEEFVQPFDLGKAPLLRVKLYKYSNESINNKYLFLFDMHHIISDGISMEILMKEFIDLYEGKELPKVHIQNKDYAVWQNNFIKKSEDIQRQEKFWIKTLNGITSSDKTDYEIPTDYPRPPVMTFEGSSFSFSINKELVEKLNLLAQNNRATLYMTLLAIYNVLLYKYTGKVDINVGALVAGRHYPNLDKTIGLFTNYLPMRNYPKGNYRFTDFLKEVKQNTLEAYDNQDYPFEKMVEIGDEWRDVSRNPIFQSMLILHNQGMQKTVFSTEKIELEMVEWKRWSSTMDLKFDFFQGMQGELNCRIEYYSKLYREETISELARHFISLVKIIADSPDMLLDHYQIFTPEEANEIKLKRQNNMKRVTIPPFDYAPKQLYYPLSPYQKLIWSMKRSVNNFLAYAELKVKVEPELILKALDVLQTEDSTLRTIIRDNGSCLYQEVLEHTTVDFKCLVERDNRKLEDCIKDEYIKPFNMEKGPLFRVRAVIYEDVCQHLIVSIHPLIAECLDSVDLLMRLLMQLQSNLNNSKLEYSKMLKPKPIKDYVYWQNQMKDLDVKHYKSFWTSILNKSLLQEVPVKYNVGYNKTNAKETVSVMLDEDEVRALKHLAEEKNISLTVIFQACYVFLLQQWLQTDEILIGLIHPLEEVISDGDFPINTHPIPILVSLKSIGTFNNLIEALIESLNSGLNNSYYPYHTLLEENDIKLQDGLSYNLLFGEEDWTSIHPDYQPISIQSYRPEKYTLRLNIVRKSNGIQCEFYYNPGQIDTSYVHILSQRYRKILETIAKPNN